MKRLEVDFLLTCNANMEIIPDAAIVFDKTIVALGSQHAMKTRFPNAEPILTSPCSVALPGLINPHVHLEFSANQGVLRFGSFVPWLQSVIAHREALQEAAAGEVIENAIAGMVESGTTTLGAISSFGLELEACAASPARVVFFTELLGSRPDAVDVLFEDFKHRLHCVCDKETARFTSALSIHSPYSTHPILAKNALDIARKQNLLVSTHFMESAAERQWIDSGKGEFADFFNAFSPYAKPLSSGQSYLELFKGTRTLFTHAVHALPQELAIIKAQGGSITHCPTSNRLLGTGVLDIDALKTQGIPLTLGTDGLSSNISLSLWDEMRAALFCHAAKEPNALARTLLEAATRHGGEALGLNVGVLEAEKEADIIVMETQGMSVENLPLHLLLHATKPSHVFIQGAPL
jgi:cytosine/adenosine deaminase-related metal-dependent hydrolase